MQTQPQIKKRVMMTQVAEQLETQLEVQATGRVQCDSCSARAMIVSILPYGELSFCMHHYNQHAQALTDQGGIAKLLSVNEDQIGNHMNFGKGGQNIVQAGSGNANPFRGAANNILGAYLGTKIRRTERDYHRQKDEESRIRVNEAQNMSKVKSELLKSMVNPAAGAHGAAEAYRIANQVHPEGHPQAGQYVNEEMANQVNRYGFDVGYRPAKTPASITQVAEWKKYRDENPKVGSKDKGKNDNKVDTSAAIASSPVGGFNPKEQDIQDSLRINNASNVFPFESTAGSSGNFSPTKFNDDGTPVYSEINAEEDRADAAKNPFNTKEGYKERTANLTAGINDGKGGNK